MKDGDATDVLLDYNSVSVETGNLQNLFAAFQEDGVYFSPNRGQVCAASAQQMAQRIKRTDVQLSASRVQPILRAMAPDHITGFESESTPHIVDRPSRNDGHRQPRRQTAEPRRSPARYPGVVGPCHDGCQSAVEIEGQQGSFAQDGGQPSFTLGREKMLHPVCRLHRESISPGPNAARAPRCEHAGASDRRQPACGPPSGTH